MWIPPENISRAYSSQFVRARNSSAYPRETSEALEPASARERGRALFSSSRVTELVG